MSRTSRWASDGRFDSATSLPATTPGSPVDNETSKHIPYFSLKSARTTETVSYPPPRLPAASRHLYTVVPFSRSTFTSPAYLSSDDTSSSASTDTRTSSATDRLTCEACNKEFTGKYARGNLGRHTRQYHTHVTSAPLECGVDGCPKTFARSDARLKHQRMHHPEFHSNSSTSPINIGVVPVPINLGVVPVSIQASLRNIRTKLGDEAYTHICDMFLYLFSRIVQYLRDKGSNTYHVYMDVLEETLATADAVESVSVDSMNRVIAESVLVNRPHHGGTASSNKGKGSVFNLGSSSISRTDLSHSSEGQKPTHGQANGSPSHKVAINHQNESSSSRLINCPDYKHHAMNNELSTSPCRGCQVKNMSQVRHHIRRTKHPGRPGIRRCSTCKKNFNYEEDLKEHRKKSCQTLSDSRTEVVIPWAMLYLTRYPEAQRIPSPYEGEMTWLDQWIWERCRVALQDVPALTQNTTPPLQNTTPSLQNTTPSLQNTTPSLQNTTAFPPYTPNLFPGHVENSMSAQGLQITYGTNNIPVESYQATENFRNWLLSHVTSSISNSCSDILPGSSTAGFGGVHQSGQNLPLIALVKQQSVLFRELGQDLESFAQHLESQAEVAIAPLANAAETVVNNTLFPNQFQSPDTQVHGQDLSNAALNSPATYLYGSSQIDTSDLRREQHDSIQNVSFNQHNNQYSTPTMSTRSSQTSVPTGSYPTQPSSATDLSSAHEPADDARSSSSHFPHHCRRGTGNSDVLGRRIPPPKQSDLDDLAGLHSASDDPRFIEADKPQPSTIDAPLSGQISDPDSQHDDMLSDDINALLNSDFGGILDGVFYGMVSNEFGGTMLNGDSGNGWNNGFHKFDP